MTNVGEVKKKPGTTALKAGLVIASVGAVLMVLNAINEGRPPGWTLMVISLGLITALAGYATRILAAVERR